LWASVRTCLSGCPIPGLRSAGPTSNGPTPQKSPPSLKTEISNPYLLRFASRLHRASSLPCRHASCNAPIPCHALSPTAHAPSRCTPSHATCVPRAPCPVPHRVEVLLTSPFLTGRSWPLQRWCRCDTRHQFMTLEIRWLDHARRRHSWLLSCCPTILGCRLAGTGRSPLCSASSGRKRVKNTCYKCMFQMFQMFHRYVTSVVVKLDWDVAYVAMVVHVCCKRLS
jgi:hypothetical protein